MEAFIYQMMRGWGSVCILLMQGPQFFWQNQMQGCRRPIYLGNKKYMTNAERSRNIGSKLFWLNKRHVIPSHVMLIVRDVPTYHAVFLTLFETPLTPPLPPPIFLWTFGRFFLMGCTDFALLNMIGQYNISEENWVKYILKFKQLYH